MQPFGKGSLLALLLLLLLFGLGALIPKMGGVFTDLTLRTALLGGLYLLLALGLRISPDLNGFAAMIADRLGMGGLARRLAP